MSNVLDDRTYENATQLTPEEQAANLAYFEGEGMHVEVVPEDGEVPPAVAPVEPVTPPAVVAPTPDSAAPAVDDPSIDAESRADWQSAKNDGERLGHYAKRTKKINELKTAVSDKERENEELRRQLADKTAAAAGPSPFVAPAPVPAAEAPKPAPVVEQPIVAKEFDEPEPKEPTLADFADADDPYVALNAATIKHTKDLIARAERKRTHEETQRGEVQRQQQQREQQQATVVQRQQRVRDVVQSHSDFEAVTQRATYTPVIKHLLNDKLPDGLELAYQLGLPENADFLRELNEKTMTVNGDPEAKVLGALDDGLMELGYFRRFLKSKAATPPAEAPPPAAPPAPVVPPTPPDAPPRREEAAPVPVRGRAAATLRPEDVDPMDSDERIRIRKAAGQW